VTTRRTVCLVASSGGHLLQLVQLREALHEFRIVWVTFDTADAQSLLEGEDDVVWAFHPTNRSIKNLVRNFWLALRVLRSRSPVALISTGAGVAVPFFYAARLLSIPSIFIESFSRITSRSLTGRLVSRGATRFYVQWPELQAKYPRSVFRGSLL
jgi:UDP-N-acetylglucosamine:LPS N-acetylglucosamine transferase